MDRSRPPRLIEELGAAGRDVEVVVEPDPVMGQAGAPVRHPDGVIEGAPDRRSDELAAA